MADNRYAYQDGNLVTVGFLIKKYNLVGASYPLLPGVLEYCGAKTFTPATTADNEIALSTWSDVNGSAVQDKRTKTTAELNAADISALAATDSDMARVTEDLIDLLVSKGVITEAELPQGAQDKLTNRRSKRAAIGA